MTIAPGTFLTPAMEHAPRQIIDTFADMQPFPKRLGHPYEYAMLVEQIVDNPMLNGETISIDGAVRFPPRCSANRRQLSALQRLLTQVR